MFQRSLRNRNGPFTSQLRLNWFCWSIFCLISACELKVSQSHCLEEGGCFTAVKLGSTAQLVVPHLVETKPQHNGTDLPLPWVVTLQLVCISQTRTKLDIHGCMHTSSAFFHLKFFSLKSDKMWNGHGVTGHKTFLLAVFPKHFPYHLELSIQV